MTVELWMVFEAIGPKEETVNESMREHLESLGSNDGVEITEREEEETQEMDDPHPSLEKGFSKVVEVMVEIESFPRALETVINYGPTYVQFEGPESFEMGMKDAQDSLQTVANTMHEYAQKGVGGVVVSRKTDEQTS